MANLAFDSPVTLVIKTPNQKIDDLRIDCALEWSVEQLKKHLSSVYPTQPESQHQRIIYSGQLLNDNLILKDVFREHVDGKQHTVHLVCPMKSETQSTTDSKGKNEPSAPTTNANTSTEMPSTAPTTSQIASDGLRYRGANTPTYPPFNMFHQQMANAAYNLPAQGLGYAVPPFVPPPYWMQQMFAQQMAAGRIPQPNMYMPANYGYPQMPYPWFPQAGNLPAPQVPLANPPALHVPQTPPPQQPAAQPQAPQPQGNENAQGNANAGPLFNDEDDDEENPNRDWLDKIYTLCRVGILLSIFWFYSSTTRFLVLILTFVLIYLYQSGVFAIFRRGNNRQEIPMPAPAPPPQPEQQAEQRQGGNAPDSPQGDVTDNAPQNTEENGLGNGDETTATPALPTPPPGPSAATVAFNFVTSFFTSLFPNTPAVQN